MRVDTPPLSRRRFLQSGALGLGPATLIGTATGRGQRSAAVDVTEFGAVGDGTTDDSAAIQAALDAVAGQGGVVLFPRPPVAYYIGRTSLEVGDDTMLVGEQSRLVSQLQRPDTGGSRPTTILRNRDPRGGNARIHICGLVFDGGWTGQNRVQRGDLSTSANTVRFERVTDLRLVGCTITRHTSNWVAEHEEDWSAAGLVRCTDVLLQDCQLTDYDTEGIVFVDAEHIRIVNLRVSSPQSGWTPLHLWYCTDALVHGGRFENSSASGGSVINACCAHLTIEHCHVRGGRGIDLSNELNRKPFQQRGNVVRDCHVSVSLYGVMRQPIAGQGVLEGLVLEGNTIEVGAGDRGFGIRLDEVQSAVIQGNIVRVDPDIGAGFQLAGVRGVRISENTVEATAMVRLAPNDGRHIEDLTVENNAVTLRRAAPGVQLSSGQSCVLFVRNETRSTTPTHMHNVRFRDNTVRGFNGAIAYMGINAPDQLDGKGMLFQDNRFESGSPAQAGFALSYLSDVRIVRNQIQAGPHTLRNCHDVEILGNEVEVPGVEQPVVWTLRGTSGAARFVRNRVRGGAQATHVRAEQVDALAAVTVTGNDPATIDGLVPSTVGPRDRRPRNPVVGQEYFDLSRGHAVWWNGREWVDASGRAR